MIRLKPYQIITRIDENVEHIKTHTRQLRPDMSSQLPHTFTFFILHNCTMFKMWKTNDGGGVGSGV